MAGSDEKPPVRWCRDSGLGTVGVFHPPRFVAWELALVQLTEPTAEGSTRWKKLASVSLARAP